MTKKIIIDQMGREIQLEDTPRRIISLVPSITEYLIDIGAPVVGRTKFCVHPDERVRDIPVIGGTKKFKFDRIAELKPDLIIGNKEENYFEGIQVLEQRYPVWMSDIVTLEDGYDMMRSLGRITGNVKPADDWILKVQNRMDTLHKTKSGNVLYLIWKNPWMAVGSGTYIDSFLNHLGYENCLTGVRYPELTESQIREINPETILLSSEPFPFKEKHVAVLNEICPEARVELVDGEMFSWYGSRIAHL